MATPSRWWVFAQARQAPQPPQAPSHSTNRVQTHMVEDLEVETVTLDMWRHLGWMVVHEQERRDQHSLGAWIAVVLLGG